jgi:molybdopterin-containing oxidoreductase family membrane subunit
MTYQATQGDNVAPLIAPGHDYATITDKISATVLERKTPKGMLITLAVSFTFVLVLIVSVSYLFYKGIGIWGVNNPVGW